ncbi:MAG: hypothetical protein R3B54_13605 [Bdellovibrionota bacterium]
MAPGDRLRQLDPIDADIRGGRGKQAQAALQQCLAEGVNREDSAAFAALARRVSLHTEAIKLLNPIVRPTGKADYAATDAEKAEYAANLTYIGAHSEAVDLLTKIKTEKTPTALLYHAFALFAQWNYTDAIPLLEKYVGHPEIRGYWSIVGKVNLVAALVYERHTLKADFLLRQLLHNTSLTTSTFLYGNCLELAAQNFIHQKLWTKAEQFLNEAAGVLSATGTWYDFYVRKWKAILDLLRKGEPALPLLDAVRLEARELRHWETIRDCDRFEALTMEREALLLKLHFGTPFEAFKTRLLGDAAWYDAAKLPSAYSWQLQSVPAESEYSFFNDPGKTFASGELIHRTLVTLCSDLYRPLRVATLFHDLFPQEYYNPRVSPKRVHEAIRRVRKWLKEAKTNLEVQESEGQYWLTSEGPACVNLVREIARTQEDARLSQLQEAFADQSFSAKQAAEILGVSARTVARLLEQPISEGLIQTEGEGRAKRYRFSTSTASAA